uniref:Uncharacterized protein n=1 Tax=Cajanus cajan TaxID=3821 RepID=A0A151TEX4_CAJCA|nr:hypothetical protein KK1_011842 [Cajanus cajan]
MSKKSKLLYWFSAYSARVLGGVPYALHSKTPPQSPVWQCPRPEPSKLHPVRAQMRAPFVPAATSRAHDCPEFSLLPPPGTAAAHTG